MINPYLGRQFPIRTFMISDFLRKFSWMGLVLVVAMAGCKSRPRHVASQPLPTTDTFAIQLANAIRLSGFGIGNAAWKRNLQIPRERKGVENGTEWSEHTIQVHNSEILTTEYFEEVTKRYVYINDRPVYAHRLELPRMLDSMNMNFDFMNIVIDHVEQDIFVLAQDPSYMLLISAPQYWGGQFRFCQLISARKDFSVEFIWEIDEASKRALRNWRQ